MDLKWPEMRSKVNFGHPKWPTSAILSKISKQIKVAYRSEMARNAIESYLRTSKMAAGGHFVKNKKKSSIWIWNGQKCHRKWISDIQNGRSIWNGQKCDPKWFPDIQNGRRKKNLYRFEMARIAIKSEFQKSKMADRSEMPRNAIESEFRTSKMADVSHFVKNLKKI